MGILSKDPQEDGTVSWSLSSNCMEKLEFLSMLSRNPRIRERGIIGNCPHSGLMNRPSADAQFSKLFSLEARSRIPRL